MSVRNFIAMIGLALAASACNGGGSGNALGTDQVTGTPQPVPSGGVENGGGGDGGGGNTGGGSGSNVIGDSCSSSDSNHICLALKYVVYNDSSGKAVVSQDEAITNVQGINKLWATCNIGFQIETYEGVDPSKYGLSYSSPSNGELDTIRSSFVDQSTLLVVTTGPWNGSLGTANAWTTMPGGGTYGVVLESPVGTYAPIIAHELGHYLNLDHVSDTSNLMDPVIYDTSTVLTSDQCSQARSAAAYYWKAMYR